MRVRCKNLGDGKQARRNRTNNGSRCDSARLSTHICLYRCELCVMLHIGLLRILESNGSEYARQRVLNVICNHSYRDGSHHRHHCRHSDNSSPPSSPKKSVVPQRQLGSVLTSWNRKRRVISSTRYRRRRNWRRCLPCRYVYTACPSRSLPCSLLCTSVKIHARSNINGNLAPSYKANPLRLRPTTRACLRSQT